MEEKTEEKKMRERIQWGINLIKTEAKKNDIPFDKDIFLQGCKIGETMWVRSEIQYSQKKQ